MNTNTTPSKCGESVNIGGTYICRLAILPCPVMRNEGCAKERVKSFEDAIKRIFNEVEE